MRVWTHEVSTEKSTQGHIKKYGPQYNVVCCFISLWEYNCSENKLRLISLTDYKKDGGVICIYDVPSPWILITPGSQGENLFNIVCNSH